jgi:hypothetical protein
MELFSAYCVNGRWLLEADRHKEIVADSLKFIVQSRRISLFGYVILPGEFHLLWKKLPAWESKNVGQMLLKSIAHRIRHHLKTFNTEALEVYKSPLRDRQYQFWERGSGATYIHSEAMAREKLQQMHEAPVVAGLCGEEEAYPFSSAAFYLLSEAAPRPQARETRLLTHYRHCFPP